MNVILGKHSMSSRWVPRPRNPVRANPQSCTHRITVATVAGRPRQVLLRATLAIGTDTGVRDTATGRRHRNGRRETHYGGSSRYGWWPASGLINWPLRRSVLEAACTQVTPVTTRAIHLIEQRCLTR